MRVNFTRICRVNNRTCRDIRILRNYGRVNLAFFAWVFFLLGFFREYLCRYRQDASVVHYVSGRTDSFVQNLFFSTRKVGTRGSMYYWGSDRSVGAGDPGARPRKVYCDCFRCPLLRRIFVVLFKGEACARYVNTKDGVDGSSDSFIAKDDPTVMRSFRLPNV